MWKEADAQVLLHAMPPSSLSRDLNFQRVSSIQPAPFFGLLPLLFCLMMMKRSSCHLKQTLKAVLSSVLITMPHRRL
jgi:hypothetical protein